MKKNNLLIKTTLASTLLFSGFTTSVLAHDALEYGVSKEAEFVFDADAVERLEYNVNGSKNLKFLHQAASVQISEQNGIQNNTADVYAHKGYAYLGTHTINGANGGVRVFDLKDPSNPVEVAIFANEIPFTWQEKVIVKSVNTPHFKGDLAVVSVQQTSRNNANRPESIGGVLLYDVSNPADPKKLGFYELDRRITGTHELYLTTQGNRAILLTSNPYADYYTHGVEKDFQIIDVSDPSNPEKLWQFDPRDLDEVPQDFNGYHWFTPDGKTRPVFNHSVITDHNGQFAYVSMWDLGTVIFDIKDPENPVYVGRTDYRDNQKGAAHSAALARGGTVLIETREIANPVGEGYESAYGYTRIFDIKDKANPVLLSEFTTDLTFDIPPTPVGRTTFAKTVHDPKVHGNTLYLSYYSGGVLAVDITDPSNPVEIARYTPESSNVWGVFVDRNYILASDMGQGLKVLLKNKNNKN
ncbi:MAG: LVIVD repeat-containing protein [Anaerobacillus sp.]|uniref:LVIVD repeat-containing protein n=1 Tax=Anaerobacillus sp. TaxID=1872506 RepID=UPI0039188D77